MDENYRPTSQLTIFNLPVDDVIVTHLGKYLSPPDIVTLGQCSRDFSEIARRMLRNMRVVYKNSQKISGNWDINLLQKCRCLRKLILHSEYELTDELLTTLIINNPKLEEISLRRASQVTQRGLEALLRLKNLSGLRLIKTYCNDDFLEKLTVNNTMLHHIYLSYNADLTLPCMENFFKTQSNLQHVSLDFDFDGNEKRLQQNVRQNLNLNSLVNVVMTVCPNLRYFIIQRDTQTIDTEIIRKMQENCNDIQFIAVSDIIYWTKGHLTQRVLP